MTHICVCSRESRGQPGAVVEWSEAAEGVHMRGGVSTSVGYMVLSGLQRWQHSSALQLLGLPIVWIGCLCGEGDGVRGGCEGCVRKRGEGEG